MIVEHLNTAYLATRPVMFNAFDHLLVTSLMFCSVPYIREVI